jgi:hypothetical protein
MLKSWKFRGKSIARREQGRLPSPTSHIAFPPALVDRPFVSRERNPHLPAVDPSSIQAIYRVFRIALAVEAASAM